MALASSLLLSGTLPQQRQAISITAGCPVKHSPLPHVGFDALHTSISHVGWISDNPPSHERWLSSDMLQTWREDAG